MPRRALHRWSFLLWFTVLLYGPHAPAATDAPPAVSAAPGADPVKAPHIALLLPTGSEAFARAAEAVREGFSEAAKKHSGARVNVRLYAVADDPQSAVATYRQAVASGARMIVGPLTRNAVTALATTTDVISVPTLALNVPEGVLTNPLNMYTLSLQIEAEARQVAQTAIRDGRRKALTITDPSLLGRRMRDAFVDELQRGGGYAIADYAYATDSAALERLRQVPASGAVDMVFLALDASRARIVRPQVSALPAYGTSQINPGASAASFVDLSDVRFVDMPWVLQPDHPAVMVYSRGTPHAADDLERLRALGIDAFRIAHELSAGKRELDVDGVTGKLTLGPGGQIRRVLPIATIAGGQVTVTAEPQK